jgi:hypothetical protein
VDGTPVYIWEKKIKKEKQAIKDWVKASFHNTKGEVERYKKKLEALQEEMDTSEIQTRHLEQEKEHFQNYLRALHNEEKEWRLKSRALWLQAGDKNTSFFHKQAKARQHKNTVEEIKKSTGEVVNSFEEIKKEASSHFKNLYTQDGVDNKEQSLQFMEQIPQLIKEQDNQELTKVVTEAEVKAVVYQFDPDKSPGLDGFTLHFYRNCWEIIKKDLLCMIRYVQTTCKLGGATNTSFLALIPKVKNANSFDRFHPISLCNVSYKILTKIIAKIG